MWLSRMSLTSTTKHLKYKISTKDVDCIEYLFVFLLHLFVIIAAGDIVIVLVQVKFL